MQGLRRWRKTNNTIAIRKVEEVAEKKFKHVCQCTNCGNESEMVVTCTLADESAEEVVPKVVQKKNGKTFFKTTRKC